MRKIWKFELAEKSTLQLPVDAEILTVGSQKDQICLWVALDTTAPKVDRHFVTVGTGQVIASEAVTFLGSAFLYDNQFVFHVFEKL
jgi:hypothetical protein